MNRILRHVGHKDFRKTRQRQISEEKERVANKLKECIEAEVERRQIEEASRPYKSDWRSEFLVPAPEEDEFVQRVVSEGMTTSGMFQTIINPEGDVDLESVYDSISLNANTVDSGENATVTTRGFDVTRYDTIKFTVTQLTSGTQGLRLFGNYGSDPNVFYILRNDLKANPIVTIQSYYKNRENFRFQVRSFNEDPGNMATYRVSASLQRRTPINVFVSLDSPEATAFIRTDPIMRGLSADERRKKLEEMLESGNEYLLKALGLIGNKVEFADTGNIPSWEQAAGEQPEPSSPESSAETIKSKIPNLYKGKSGAWLTGAIGASSIERLTDEFRGTNVRVKFLKAQAQEAERESKTIAQLGRMPSSLHNEKLIQQAQDRLENAREKIKAEIEGTTPNLKPITEVPKISDDRVELEKNIQASLKQLDIDNEQLKGEALKRNIAFAADLGLDILTVITLLSPIPGDEAAALTAQATKAGIKTGAKQVSKNAVQSSIKKNVFKNIADDAANDASRATADLLLNKARYGDDALKYVKKLDDAAASGNTDLVRRIVREIDNLDPLRRFNKPPVPKPPTKPSVGTNPGGAYPRNSPMRPVTGPQGTLRNSYHPQGEVLTEKKKIKSPKEVIANKIPGYYDGKPAPLGFPMEPPAKIINGFHADLVTSDGQKKQSARYNRLDPISAKAMPPTGNPYIDKKVKAAAMKLKEGQEAERSNWRKDLQNKIPGYYDGKPSPLGFPDNPPPKMVNGYHPDLVDGKKVADRFNRLDPQSARAMPPTGNPHIDKKVKAAAKKLKEWKESERPYKSNWRKEFIREFGEWIPIDGAGPTNSTSQTFGYFVGGVQQFNFETGQPITYTASGLGGVEASNTGGQTIVDGGYGEFSYVDAPTYNQLAMQGHVGYVEVLRRQDQNKAENERIDSEIKKIDNQVVNLERIAREEQSEFYSNWIKRYETWEKNNPRSAFFDTVLLSLDLLKTHGDKMTQGEKKWLIGRMKLNDQYRSQSELVDDKANLRRQEAEKLRAKIIELENQRPWGSVIDPLNQQLDASQEFVQNVGADYMMNARPMTTDMDKFMEMYRNRWQDTEGPAAAGTGAEGQWWTSMADLINSGMSYNDALKQLGQMPPREKDPYKLDADVVRREAEGRKADREIQLLKGSAQQLYHGARYSDVLKDILQMLPSAIEKINQNAYASDLDADAARRDEIELERIRDLLGPEAAKKYEQSLKKRTTKKKITNNTLMLPTFSGLPRYNPLAPLTQLPMGLPGLDAAGSTFRYAFGNYDPNVPVKGGQSAALELAILNTISNAIKNGALTKDANRPGYYSVPGTDAAYQGDGSIGNNYFTNAAAQALLQSYSFKPTKNGVIVKDRFNLTGSTNIGMFRAIPGAQQLADYLVGMGHQKIRNKGGNPMDDKTAGFDLEFKIPWERIPNNHPLRKGGNVNESTTWDKLKRIRKNK